MQEKFEIPENKEKTEKAKVEDLRNRMRALYEKDRILINEKVVRFARYLKGQYGYEEVGKYVLYHALAFSDYRKGDCKFFDFPGDDSIEKFVEYLEKEQEEKQEEEKEEE